MPATSPAKATLLTKDEQEILTSQNQRMFQIRADIGMIELRKLDAVAAFGQEHEASQKFLGLLADKYGKDAVFNIHTGQITYKTDGKD